MDFTRKVVNYFWNILGYFRIFGSNFDEKCQFLADNFGISKPFLTIPIEILEDSQESVAENHCVRFFVCS